MSKKTESIIPEHVQYILDELDAQHVNLFVVRLEQQKERQISLQKLWSLFHEVFSSQLLGPDRRSSLLAVLYEAQQLGIIHFPAATGRCWEKSLTPHLPLWIRQNEVPSAPAREKNWKSFPWDARLAWITELEQLSTDQETFLLQVQKELVRGTFLELAPIAYRSLQLMGNEKRLKALASTALFRPGRLSYEFLGCITDTPPFALEKLGSQPRVLIFENASSFRTALRILKQLPHNPYGLVGFGGGTGFEQAVLHLQTISHPLEHIEYVGDLDRPGLRTARTASMRAQTEGLPPVQAASGIHQAMLMSCAAFRRPLGIDYLPGEKRKHPEDEALVAWLPGFIRQRVLEILQAGRRVPEEVLGPKEFVSIWS